MRFEEPFKWNFELCFHLQSSMLAVWKGEVVVITNSFSQMFSWHHPERQGCPPRCSTIVFQKRAKADSQREQLKAAPLQTEGARLQDNNNFPQDNNSFPPHLL